MPYEAFHERCPEVALRETRVATLLTGNNLGLPADDYGFHEMYCNEPGCDCRRVFFTVISSKKQETEAVINWGWEDAAFYARWYGQNDPEIIREMQGPGLCLSSPQSRNAGGLLRLFATVLVADPAYRERIKRHYALFRQKRGGGASQSKDRARRMLTKGLFQK